MSAEFNKNAPLRRIVVVGAPGSGKSTFAARLAESLGARYVEVDRFIWGPHWTARPRGEWLADLERELADSTWVVEGHFGKARDLLLSRADALVWLDTGLPKAFYRLGRRTMNRVVTKKALWGSNRETWRRAFASRESPLWVLVRDYRARRKDFAEAASCLPSLRFATDAEAEAWLADLTAARRS